MYKKITAKIHIDLILLGLIITMATIGLVILYSASGNTYIVPIKQVIRYAVGFSCMLCFAYIPPSTLARYAPHIYLVGIALLVVVFFTGHIGKGAQRWVNLGVFNFEPSEVMKIALPLLIAKILQNTSLPISNRDICKATILILLPVMITAMQPDLGTAILLCLSGGCVVFLAGLRWRIIFSLLTTMLISIPIFWNFLHNYQKQRVLTFLNPEGSPLSTGYHIIQSKIAIGSGGIFGKGWLQGSQSHLNFLPENATDFIFSHICEEFGLIGAICIIALILAITARGFIIASNAQDTFSRLVAGSISTNFFFYAFINIGMTTGILPVVGVPLPLISYGGSFLVTILIGQGILMSIQSHKKLIDS